MTTVERRSAGRSVPEFLGVVEGAYVLRAELPGLDAESDIAVNATGDRLTVTAKRERGVGERHRSEFRRDSFSRTVALPKAADIGKIAATYERGVLEVRVPLTRMSGERRIRVRAQPE